MFFRQVNYFAGLPRRVWRWSLPTKITVIAAIIASVVGIRSLGRNGTDLSAVSTAERELIPFEGKTPGLLICRFGGNNLERIFGDEGIAHNLGLRVYDQIDSLGLRDHLQVKVIDTIARSDSEALRLSERYHAKFVVWGSIVDLGQKAQVNFLLDAGILVFVVGFDSNEVTNARVNLRTGRRFDLDLDSQSFNFDSFAWSLATTLLPSLAISLANDNPALAVKVLEGLPRWDKWYLQSNLNGFLVLSLGSLCEKTGDARQAVHYYHLAYDMFESMYDRKKRGINDSIIVDDETLRKIAAKTKWMEGIALLGLLDTSRAKECLNLASCTDTSIMRRAAENIAIIDTTLDSTAITISCLDTTNAFLDWYDQ